jgi:uncharacterized protein
MIQLVRREFMFMAKKEIAQFEKLVEEYTKHPKVLEMKKYKHHGIERFDHCKRVAYFTYHVTKLLHLNVESTTKAAMLHDFFTDEVMEEGAISKLRWHPEIAAENAREYFGLNDMEEDIIMRHMFPITFIPPRYLEGWIVDIIDDLTSIYERGYSMKKQFAPAMNAFVLFILTIIK